MSSSDSQQEPELPSPDAAASPLSFRKRLFRRVKYWVIGGSVCGVYLGSRVSLLEGAVVGLAAGAVIGLCIGLVIGGYAWFLESPLKGAIRGAGLLATMAGVIAVIRGLEAQGQREVEIALIVGSIVIGLGAVAGAILGAFLAWLAGPLFQEVVQEADRGDSPLKSRPWW